MVSQDLQRYLGLFVSESTDKLQKLGQGLVRLEAAGRGEEPLAPIVDEMFRHAHSVKGMSASMELEGIKEIAHRAEGLLDHFRKTGDALDPASVDLLLAAVDAMTGMVERSGAGENPAAPAELLSRLDAGVARIHGGAAPAPPRPETPAPHRPTPAAEQVPLGLRRRYTIEVEVAGTCPVPAVRGFLVLKKLSALGAVLEATPAAEDLRAGRIPDRRVKALLESGEPPAAVEKALSQISDIATVQVKEEVHHPTPPPAVAATAQPREPEVGGRTVRVRVELLDSFLDAVGELILATARIREVGKSIPEAVRPALDEGVDRLQSAVKDLHDKVMTARMTPLALLTDRLPRVARDLARRVGKQVEVEVEGAEIEIDRAILDELADPLTHLVRNAVDHGLEPSHLRELSGKPATGRLSVSARRERDRVILDVVDDGRGMDPEALRQAAVARGAISAAAAAALSDRDALQLACLPGVSTADRVTDISGRGVGMDAVKRVVEAVGGALELVSVRGHGTRVSLRLPLTVAVQPVLLVRVGEEVLGLPIAKVHGAAQADTGALERSRGEPMLPYDGGLVPVRELSALLGLPRDAGSGPRQVVVADGDGARVGLAVDALLGQEEAVLKPLGRPLDLVSGLSAVTVLGNGRPVFILDVPRLGP
ncbi:MAG: chemotaxis protein CheA [Deltaproteobacteria bacterium]|nr:chemotaxis protein CheA [Deltaproteobacteria bacterium]